MGSQESSGRLREAGKDAEPSRAEARPHQPPTRPHYLLPCPRRGAGHLGVGVEQLEQGHDEGLHRDIAATVFLQVVGHGGALLLVEQVPGLLLQQHTRLVPQAAQGHLGAGWPLVKSQLRERGKQRPEDSELLRRQEQASDHTAEGRSWSLRGVGPPSKPTGDIVGTFSAYVAWCTFSGLYSFRDTFTYVISSDPCDHSEASNVIKVPILVSGFQHLPWGC